MVRNVPIHVGRFPVHCSGQLVSTACYQDIQECQSPLFFLLNCEFNVIWLRCVWKDCRFCSPWGQMTKVSSTYLSQRLGRSGAECMACSSRSSMERFAMMGDRGEPMGVPSICSKTLLWNWKQVDLKHNSMSSTSCGTGMQVLSIRVGSLVSLALTTSNASSIGT